ncbi:hypothetical protein [Floridanema evergladense]|uniref:Uncharacterized protein n=1 Tax=Floridaenema evergladense BLCC-F167 TaxID=3153639 RepID=A0ABV4WPA8_9CYAN
MTSTDPLLKSALQHLRELRKTLLRLHKALLDSERVEYEQLHGRIKSSNEFFQLVIGDEWFSWLRPISQFIVQIDEFLASKEPVTLNEANQLLEQARVLIQPCSEGTRLEKQYYRAIQRDPDIAFMSAEVTKILAK